MYIPVPSQNTRYPYMYLYTYLDGFYYYYFFLYIRVTRRHGKPMVRLGSATTIIIIIIPRT